MKIEFELANGWKKEWNWSEQTEAMKFDEAGNKQSQEWIDLQNEVSNNLKLIWRNFISLVYLNEAWLKTFNPDWSQIKNNQTFMKWTAN